ncbi:TPA: hypothetical protein ACX3LH_001833 [Klebsiella michiganensis]
MNFPGFGLNRSNKDPLRSLRFIPQVV